MDSTPTSNITIAKRSSWQVMRDVVSALFVRELKTRFGGSRLGYFWAIMEPVGQMAVLSAMFYVTGRTVVGGIEIPAFLFLAILPFSFFTKLLTNLSQGIESNRALLIYPQMQPIDPVFTRFFIEIAVFVVSYMVIIIGLAWFGLDVVPHDPLKLIGASALVLAIGFGGGLALCSAALFWSDVNKLIGLFTRPMFFMSGIFFSTLMIPTKYWIYFQWNPILHLIELSRMSMAETYYTAFPNWYYPAFIALVLNALGLILYRVNRQRFAAS